MTTSTLAPRTDPIAARRLFTAGCIALIATAMSFAIRGDIMGDFERLSH